jgi:hypothetical protein
MGTRRRQGSSQWCGVLYIRRQGRVPSRLGSPLLQGVAGEDISCAITYPGASVQSSDLVHPI